MRLHRPYIPWSVREQVINRQMAEANFTETWAIKYAGSTARRVRWKLEEFFAGKAVELHHRPALVNRQRCCTGCGSTQTLGELLREHPLAVSCCPERDMSGYKPDANDPDFLVYLVAGAGEEHDVETRVRGQHGQHSDLALARKRRRAERKRNRPKRKWPKRRLRSRRR